MKILSGLLVSSLIGVSGACLAYTTYTKSELNIMYSNGSMPSQASPVSKSGFVGFSSCISQVKAIWHSTAGYPSSVLFDNSEVFAVKLWTNDAAMVMTCSRLDSKLVITTSKYL